jgi:uncharacterized protein YigA (DUF484 family)
MATAGPARSADLESALRAQILAEPALVLDDPALMRALAEAAEVDLGGNVVDLRGVAMERLEARLARLEETHRAVIAAAYENLSAAMQVQRAVLRLLDETGFEGFLAALGGDVASTLRVRSVRLVLESARVGDDGTAALARVAALLSVAGPGTVEAAMSAGRKTPVRRQIVLRQCEPGAADPSLHGEAAALIGSEALMRLDLGPGRLPGLVVLGAEDAQHFRPGQGTDLLAFFTGVVERAMRRWLA